MPELEEITKAEMLNYWLNGQLTDVIPVGNRIYATIPVSPSSPTRKIWCNI